MVFSIVSFADFFHPPSTRLARHSRSFVSPNKGYFSHSQSPLLPVAVTLGGATDTIRRDKRAAKEAKTDYSKQMKWLHQNGVCEQTTRSPCHIWPWVIFDLLYFLFIFDSLFQCVLRNCSKPAQCSLFYGGLACV